MSNRMSAAVAVAALLGGLAPVALPGAAAAQQANGITNCDAPGGRQQTGALLGAVVGGVVGSNVARNERTLGTVAGAAAGAAAGSYIGCNQQRARAAGQSNGNMVQATSNLRIRSGPGVSYRQVGSLSAGQPVTAVGSEPGWVQIAGGGWVSADYVRAY
ncbi:MAG: SH3 domain-containing protein [Brevundimonas sp.]|uniref:SH3 domain-containing protein n=1 Tax=Brevundimonas sp. TaxID=1871086 RepID=UPI0025B99CF1|nr:SH3 domain-containing protein [Brevundimonas sp.]MBX3477856.1 SH3 domain-containing protein [Brevundimonas sp.]